MEATISAVLAAGGDITKPEVKLELKNFDKNKKDYWLMMRSSTKRVHEYHVEKLLQVGETLPVNLPYLMELATELDIPTPNTPKDLKSFLLRVPLLLQFDLCFNSFVSKEANLGSLPYICIYPHFTECLDGFVNFVAGHFIEGIINNQFELKSRKIVSNTANAPHHFYNYLSIIHMLLGKSYVSYAIPTDTFSTRFPSAFRELGFMQSSAKSFVKFHECGHLLLHGETVLNLLTTA